MAPYSTVVYKYTLLLSFVKILFFFSQQSAFVAKEKASAQPRLAATQFEPGIEVLQTFALPLGYGALTYNDPRAVTPKESNPGYRRERAVS